MSIRALSGIALLIFILAFGSIVLFGFYAQSSAMFRVGYFLLFLFALGAVYVWISDYLEGALQHAMMIAAVVVLAWSLAIAAGNIKDSRMMGSASAAAKQQLAGEVSGLENSTLMYMGVQNELRNRLSVVQENNAALQRKMAVTHADIAAAQKTRAAHAALQAQKAALEERQRQLALQAQQAQLELQRQQAQLELEAQRAQAALQAQAAQMAAQQSAQQTSVQQAPVQQASTPQAASPAPQETPAPQPAEQPVEQVPQETEHHDDREDDD